jgi:hypothetical protein
LLLLLLLLLLLRCRMDLCRHRRRLGRWRCRRGPSSRRSGMRRSQRIAIRRG